MSVEPDLSDVRRIASVRAPWCITIYGDADSWLRGSGDGGAADRQVRATITRLRAEGVSENAVNDARHRLTEARALIGTWGALDHHRASIAVFATESSVETFLFPEPPEWWVGVSRQFLVGPLLAGALARLPRAFVLAISESSVRLVDVTATPPHAIDVPGLPSDLRSALDRDPRDDRTGLARLRLAVDRRERLNEFARVVDSALDPVLRRARALLIIAAAEPMASIMRVALSYRVLATSRIPGVHDDDTPYELAEAAAPASAQPMPIRPGPFSLIG